ncbi:MAG: hypothetical protein A3C55_01510 [Gammaproteobacteria bacterium RIFCSPHIGHO2_02_FULL_42_13]|nr:MAG: hypothetical protein A3C55_01510 [Gammaproteobacteria bacterium RIFCSPHIGHO2_02_FULL_42_13]
MPCAGWIIVPQCAGARGGHAGLQAFKENRGNGDAPGWFDSEFPKVDQIPDQFYSWTTADGRRFPVQRDPKDKDIFHCPTEVQYKKSDGYWYAALRLDESPQMRACMERRDVEYIRQLRTLGKLLEKEPNGDAEIKAAEDTPADKDGWGHLHQFHDEIFAAFAAARKEVKQFGKELSDQERQERQERERQALSDLKPMCSCPLTQKIFIDPVVAADGETYEREAIEAWFETNQTSPKTKNPIADKSLRPCTIARRLQQTLLTLSPELRTSDELYLSLRLQQRLLQSVAEGQVETLITCTTADERLFIRPMAWQNTGDKKSLLIWALESKHLPVVQAVIQGLGARWDKLSDVQAGGAVLFDLAVQHLQTPGARLIMDRLGWDKRRLQIALNEAIAADHLSKAQVCLELGADIEGLIDTARPLHRAIQRKQCDWARLYVRFRADRSARNAEGFPALHQAMLSDDEEMARILCESTADAAGAAIETGNEATDAQGLTALHLTVKKADARWVARLLQLGANAQTPKLPERDTALLHAVRQKDVEITRVLLRHGVKTDTCDATGRSALHLAFDQNADECLRLLIENGVDLEQCEPNTDDTGLLRAVKARKLALVELMLARRNAPAHIHATNKKQEGVLHVCARGGEDKIDLAIMEYLIALGADGDALNEAGQTPKEVAIVCGHRGLASALSKALRQRDLAEERIHLARERAEMAEKQRQMEEQMAQLRAMLQTAGAGGATPLFFGAPAAAAAAPPPYEEAGAAGGNAGEEEGNDEVESGEVKGKAASNTFKAGIK